MHQFVAMRNESAIFNALLRTKKTPAQLALLGILLAMT
jgi:hypothetical protein